MTYYANLKRPDRKAAVRSNNVLRLTLAERKRILLNNIYGVDIDVQAVEVAKLSLLLKLVEGETQLDLAVQRLLPDLHKNVQCGNSLVGSDFYGTNELINLTPAELREVNAFDWSDGFPGVAEAGGFDAVIGNPPWLMAGYYIADSKAYLQRHYSVWKGKADLYYLFLEKACRIVKKPEGRIGMIIPSKLFHTRAGAATRQLLTEGNWLESVVDFGIEAIFKKATNYSTILLLQQSSRGTLPITKAKKYFASPSRFHVDRSRFGDAPWHFIRPERQAVWDTLSEEHAPLSDVVQRFGNGAQTGADPLLIVKPDSQLLEEAGYEFFRPVLKGKDVRRYGARASNYIFFPYEVTDRGFELVAFSELPQALRDFLEQERSRLEERKWFGKSPIEQSGDWYGLMYLDQAWAFEKPHILTPGFAPESNFALGDGTLFVTGTAGVLSVIPSDGNPESIYYLLAVLNSKLGSNFICDHSTPYQGKFFKFTKNYIGSFPLRRIDFEKSSDKRLHDELVELVEGATLRQASLSTSTGQDADTIVRTIVQTQRRIDEIVLSLYDLDETEIATVLEDD